MQLTTANRREVIEDLLDIQDLLCNEWIYQRSLRTKKDQIKSLDLKKSNIKDKIKMQENFIEEVENRGNANIESNKNKIDKLNDEVDQQISENVDIEKKIQAKTKDQEELNWSKRKVIKTKQS